MPAVQKGSGYGETLRRRSRNAVHILRTTKACEAFLRLSVLCRAASPAMTGPRRATSQKNAAPARAQQAMILVDAGSASNWWMDSSVGTRVSIMTVVDGLKLTMLTKPKL